MTNEGFAELWRKMTAEERKSVRAEMETEMIHRLPPSRIFHCSEAALHRAAKQAVNDLIDRCQREC